MQSRKLKGLFLPAMGAVATVAVLSTMVTTTLTACSKNGEEDSASVGVTTQLISMTPVTALTSLKAKDGIKLDTKSAVSASSVSAMAENNNEADVVIDSYKIVLSDIAISTGTQLTGIDSDVVYQCSGTTDAACLVDLAEAGAVDGLLNASTFKIRPGAYRFAMIGTCRENISGGADQGSYIKVKARIASGGNWYYTHAAAGDSEFFLKQQAGATWNNPGDYAESKIWVSGCRTYNVFQNPITLTEGQPVAIKMFYDIRRSLTFKNDGMTQDGCTSPKGLSHVASSAIQFQVCGGYPYLAGMITDEKPDLHRYIVSTAADRAQVFGIYFAKGTTTSVGAYNYPYVGTGTYVNPENFAQVIKKASNTSGSAGKLTIVTYGGQTSNDVIDENPGEFNTTEFPILNAVNDTLAFTATDGTGATINVTAKRIE